MKKKFFSKLLMVALVATVGVFSSCKDYDDDIADVRNNLSQTATELRTDYTNKINAVNTKIETLQTSYDKLSKALDESNAQLQTLINTKFDAAVKAAEAYSDANLVKAKDAAAAAEAAAEDFAKTQAAAAQSAAIAAAKEQVAAAKAELEAALAKANELIATQGQSIANLIEADKTLDAAIKAAQARADEAYALADKANTLAETNKTNVEKAAADIAALQKSLSALESKAADKADVAKLQSDLAALQKQVGETVVNLADYKESIANITSELAKLKSDLEQQVSFLGENLAGVKKTAEANAASIESIITQLSELKKANDLAHQELANSVDALAKKTSSDLAAAVQGIEAEIAAANVLIGKNTEAIASLTQTVQSNKDAQDKINEAIKGDVAQNAKDIVAKGKEIEALQKLIPELQTTLEKYADKVAGAAAQTGKDAAAAAEATAKQFALDEIKKQADADKEAWNKAIDIAIETLVTTFKLNTLTETIQAAADKAQTNAEANAEQKAKEIAKKALEDANTYTDKLSQTLKDNYTTTTDMNAAIETARANAVNQAYLKVLNALLRDYPDWYDLTEEKKLDKDILPVTILQLAQKAAKEYLEANGLTKDNAQALVDATIKAGMAKTTYLGTDAEGNELYSKPGVIMVEIEAVANDVEKKLFGEGGIDARLKDIEDFLNMTAEKETLGATIKDYIEKAALAKAADLDEIKTKLGYDAETGDLTKVENVIKAAQQNTEDISKIMTSINNVTGMFAALLPSSEGESSIDTDLANYEKVMQALADKIFAMNDIVENLDDKVMEAVNKNLGPQIQTMITSINLFANQHMAQNDHKGTVGYWNGDRMTYPYGYDNFDHKLTFVYTVEQGIFSDLCTGDEGLKTKSWNYPGGLIEQLKGIKSDRDELLNDYEYSYNEDGFSGAGDYDFIDGRYRSYEDSILVRVSPTNADLSKAEIALLNTLGQNIADPSDPENALIEVVAVNKYTRNTVMTRPVEGYGQNGWRQTRAVEGNETGLWVIKFKMRDEQVGPLFDKYAFASTSAEKPNQTTGSIVYAVAVKNTDFSTEETEDVNRFVVSEYDLSLGLEPAKHSWDFNVNDKSVADIHNRYIQTEQAQNGTTLWTDDPENYSGSFRYELTWHPLVCPELPVQPGNPDVPETLDPVKNVWYAYCWDCCFMGDDHLPCKDETVDAGYDYNEIAYTSILFNKDYDIDRLAPGVAEGVNTCDRHFHEFTTDGKRSKADDIAEDDLSGIDNRHDKDFLLIHFSEDQAPEGETGEWARINIDFPDFNDCGDFTPLRGFFVTLDSHFAMESDNSEINSWATYTYKNVGYYNYDGKYKRKVAGTGPAGAIIDIPVTLQKGNHGVIYLKNENNVNNGEIIGFRVHAVNLDGTFTDPDGRAFYVKIGKDTPNHKLTFDILADTAQSFAVQNLTDKGVETLDRSLIDNVNGKNPIPTYNENMKLGLNELQQKSSDRFFNRDAYKASFEDAEKYRVVYTWRADNPAIRDINDLTQGYIPMEGTGYTYGVKNVYGTNRTVVKDIMWNSTYMGKGDQFDVENFFDFWYSTDANADVEGSEDHPWVQFNEGDEDGQAAPCKKTLSVKASIKAGVANRLIDGATYKITMTIMRQDVQTVWKTVNTYDIDIKKVMPTEMPKAFGVKSNQLPNGAWTFYVRPYAGVDFTGEQGDTDPWAITWGEYGVTANPNNFASIFNADKYVIDKDEQDTDLHNYRWAMDTRMYNFEDVFTGLVIDEVDENGEKTGKKTIDQNYFFIFTGAGSFAGATEDIANGATEEKADKDNADKDALAVYDTEYSDDVLQGEENADLYRQKGAYTLPLIHWSHLGQKKDVKAGYIYRDISANLNADGTAFLQPSAEKSGMTGLSITNDDYEIAPVAVKSGSSQVKAEFKCALFDAAVTLTQDNTENTFDWNNNIAIQPEKIKFKLASEKWYAADITKQAYFNTQFNTAWTKDDAGTLTDWLATPWCWVDIASLKFTTSAPDGYNYKHYYDEPYFICGKTPFDPEENTFQDITGVGMMKNGATDGLMDFKSAVTGKFTFDIYDVWFHKKTIEIKVKINKPENLTARQAR